MNRTERFIRLAFENTFHSPHNFPMACVIANGNRILSIGINRYKSHPKQILSFNVNRELHAEIDGIIGTRSRDLLKGATIYIARRRRGNNGPGMAKPCPVCFGLIEHMGIEKVVYTINCDGKNYDFNYEVERV